MTGPPLSIRRARLRNTDLDALTARLRLEPQLGTAELRPRGLPPSAVLCVRRLVDPLPGRLELDSAQARPPPEWERAFVDVLTRLLETAARPAREAVPANAESVLFADRSELLACLARDARDGVAWTRWWWHSLSPPASTGADPVIEAWLASPEHVPGALALLAARGEATAFVRALPLATAAHLARRVAAVFGAIPLERAIARVPLTPSATRARGDGSVRDGGPTSATTVAQPPWESTAPEARTPPLAPARELLLGVALALRRAPAAARSSAFATATATWLEQGAPGPVIAGAATPARNELPAASAVERPPGAPPARASGEQAERNAAAPSSETVDNTPARETGDPSRGPGADRASTAPPPHAAPAEPHASLRGEDDGDELEPLRAREETTPAAATPVGARADAPAQHTAPPGRTTDTPPQTEQDAAAAVPASAAEQAAEDEPWEAPAFGVETNLGGVFYLLNLFLYLGLYGDFTQPLARGLALDPWRCVDLVARRLLGPGDRDDPLWGMLERLATPSAFRPPRVWRVPRPWLEPFDAGGTWRWSAARGTLRLEHPAGFPVVAVPRTQEPARAQLARELRRLHLAPALRRSTLRAEPQKPLARWCSRLAAYADARLRVALELPPETVLRRRARVFVTSSHVDVVLSLVELPLEVRFAGLDRTPGWIPAAGRFVSFHFE